MSSGYRVVPVPIDIAQGVARLLIRMVTHRVDRSGGSSSARYCYSVWLRHLVKAHQAGLPAEPKSVIELGPGDSIGVGLAALLTGTDSYVALDRVAFARRSSNLAVLGELVELFQRRSPIPGDAEFPQIRPALDSYLFPDFVLGEQRLGAFLRPDRLARIRHALGGDDPMIRYVAPWDDAAVLDEGAGDMILSQAVLEHVADLEATYMAMARWLRPGGFLSHQIDFRSHNTSLAWNGHWAYSARAWDLVSGRPPIINRQPLSAHRAGLERAELTVLAMSTERDPSGLNRDRLHRDWRWLDDDDLHVAGAFVQAVAGPSSARDAV